MACRLRDHVVRASALHAEAQWASVEGKCVSACVDADQVPYAGGGGVADDIDRSSCVTIINNSVRPCIRLLLLSQTNSCLELLLEQSFCHQTTVVLGLC